VAGGLRLADEDDLLGRAEQCNDLAQGLAVELRQAAAGCDGERAAELADYLRSLLQGGLAANLSSASGRAAPRPAGEQTPAEIFGHAEQWLRPLEEQLRQPPAGADPEALRRTLAAVEEARAALREALEPHGDPRG